VRSRVVVRVSAGVVLALGLALLFPLALSLLYLDGSWASFRVPAAFMVPLQATGLQASRLREVGLALERDVYFAVTMAWGSPRCSAGPRTSWRSPSQAPWTPPSRV
jgi:hypothetical protein